MLLLFRTKIHNQAQPNMQQENENGLRQVLKTGPFINDAESVLNEPQPLCLQQCHDFANFIRIYESLTYTYLCMSGFLC